MQSIGWTSHCAGFSFSASLGVMPSFYRRAIKTVFLQPNPSEPVAHIQTQGFDTIVHCIFLKRFAVTSNFLPSSFPLFRLLSFPPTLLAPPSLAAAPARGCAPTAQIWQRSAKAANTADCYALLLRHETRKRCKRTRAHIPGMIY